MSKMIGKPFTAEEEASIKRSYEKFRTAMEGVEETGEVIFVNFYDRKRVDTIEETGEIVCKKVA